MARHDALEAWAAQRLHVARSHGRNGTKGTKGHDLGHSFASGVVKVEPLSDAQALLGHARITTTMR